MHNAQYDLGWLRASGFEVNGRIIDTMLIASLLDENRFSYSLNACSYDYLNKTKSEKDLVAAAKEFGVDPKAEMWKMPSMYVGPYAETDAVLALELWQYFRVELGKEDLWDIVNLELDLLPVLVEMTMKGVRVDTDRVERTRDEILKRERAVIKEIKKKSWDGCGDLGSTIGCQGFRQVRDHIPKDQKWQSVVHETLPSGASGPTREAHP